MLVLLSQLFVAQQVVGFGEEAVHRDKKALVGAGLGVLQAAFGTSKCLLALLQFKVNKPHFAVLAGQEHTLVAMLLEHAYQPFVCLESLCSVASQPQHAGFVVKQEHVGGVVLHQFLLFLKIALGLLHIAQTAVGAHNVREEVLLQICKTQLHRQVVAPMHVAQTAFILVAREVDRADVAQRPHLRFFVAFGFGLLHGLGKTVESLRQIVLTHTGYALFYQPLRRAASRTTLCEQGGGHEPKHEGEYVINEVFHVGGRLSASTLAASCCKGAQICCKVKNFFTKGLAMCGFHVFELSIHELKHIVSLFLPHQSGR